MFGMTTMNAAGSPSTSAIRISPGSTRKRRFLPELVEFGGGERHESPVLRPGVVEDVPQQRDLVVEALAVERPDAHAFRRGGDEPRHDGRRLEIRR